MKRFSLSAAGQPFQYLPGTDACLPMAMAGFDSIGQKPEPVKAVCLDPFFAFLPMKKEEGAGRQETKKKTLLRVARGTHKHQRTGFLMTMLLLIAMPMRSALTPQLGAQLDPGARNMTDI